MCLIFDNAEMLKLEINIFRFKGTIALRGMKQANVVPPSHHDYQFS